MLFGGTLSPSLIKGSNLFRQHLYQLTPTSKWVWPSINGPIPEAWPSLPVGVAGFYTIYPNPAQLLAGELDAKIKAFIAGAHPGSMLTAYAEADGGLPDGQWAPLGVDQAKMRLVHEKMQDLCQGSSVRYGYVCCGADKTNMAWAIPGLDFYALDWYDAWSGGSLSALNDWRRAVGKVQRSPVLAIAEINSNTPGRRPFWFSAVFGWLKGYEMENGGRAACFSTYWNPGGKLSGPWLPGDAPTIAALSSIARAAPA